MRKDLLFSLRFLSVLCVSPAFLWDAVNFGKFLCQEDA
jgi:hypothetical protein